MFRFAFHHLVIIVLLLSSCTAKPKLIIENKNHSTKEYRITEKSAKQQEEMSSALSERESEYRYSIGRTYHIALLVPITGKFASIGKQVIDMATLALASGKGRNIRIIPIDTKETDEDAIHAAERAVKLNVNIAIGPIFGSATKAAASVLQAYDIKMISLSNDTKFASENVYIFGVSPEALLVTALAFGKKMNKENYGVILPSTEYGYTIGKKIPALMQGLEINHMITEYYPRNRKLFSAVISRVLHAKTQNYRQKENGTVYLSNRRHRDSEQDEEKDPLIKRHMDALYIDAKGEMLEHLMRELDTMRIGSKYITVFSSDMLIRNDIKLGTYTQDVIFAGIANSNVDTIEDKVESTFHFKPARISMLAYDAISLVLHLVRKDRLSNEVLHSKDGYNGIFGDFRLTDGGIVQRRFGVYRINHGVAEMIYKSPLFI